jgi:hypothetical protein
MTTFTDRKINWDAVKDFSPMYVSQRLDIGPKIWR